MLRNLPLARPEPDAAEAMDILMGRTPIPRVPLVEHSVDAAVMEPILTGLLGRRWIAATSDRESQKAHLDNVVEFWHRLGYDWVRYEQSMGFALKQLHAADTVPGSERQRAWTDQHRGSIETWEDFERYPWPRLEAVDFFAFEYLNDHLPNGMGLVISHGGGIFEHLSWLMSFERLCFALYEAPDLVRAIADRLGELMKAFYEHLLDLDHVVAVFPGDDMGFRTSTLVAPDHLREYVLPWHKRFAAMAHGKGVPYFLHCCGNIELIMEDLLSDVRIDGKHSFEDVIQPVQEFQARYGDRTAALGGVDVNRLATSLPGQVRQHTRHLIDTCGPRGRYALGSGNSIPNYVPVENYLAMLDEATDSQ
jgi:uroporphyrinogen decarboxylase